MEVVAAAAVPVPDAAHQEMAALREFFRGPVRRALSAGGFTGKALVLGLPARDMHASSAKREQPGSPGGAADVGDEAASRWLRIPSARAIVRQIEAGDVRDNGTLRREVVTIAVRRAVVERYAAAAAAANLEVTSVASEPEALLAALAHCGGRSAAALRFVIDLGFSGTRVYAGVGRRLMFARCLGVGGRQLEEAISYAVGVSREQTCELRAQLPLLHEVATPACERMRLVDAACDETVERLAKDIRLCHCYLAATFPAAPVRDLVFTGGGARHRRLCQRVAEAVGLPARAANPLSRLAGAAHFTASLGNGRSVAGPAWLAALGLCAGAVATPEAEEALRPDEESPAIVGGLVPATVAR